MDSITDLRKKFEKVKTSHAVSVSQSKSYFESLRKNFGVETEEDAIKLMREKEKRRDFLNAKKNRLQKKIEISLAKFADIE